LSLYFGGVLFILFLIVWIGRELGQADPFWEGEARYQKALAQHQDALALQAREGREKPPDKPLAGQRAATGADLANAGLRQKL